MHKSSKLEQIFQDCFAGPWTTKLVGGGQEPIYLPAAPGGQYHRVVYTRDYFASALHEVAHWCIAGAERRLLVDYGYWYEPDGRTDRQQRLFERVEVLPQAIEWLFAEASGFQFRISADNIAGGQQASADFKKAVANKAQTLHRHGLSGRAAVFEQALRQHFGGGGAVPGERFRVDLLR